MSGQQKSPLISAVGVATLLGLGHAQAAETGIKTFRDWIAGCDNLKGCTALSLPAEAASDIGFLKLERSAGPAGAASFSLRLRGEQLKAPLSVQLLLDGAPFPAAGKSLPARRDGEDSATLLLSDADTEALIAAARKATRLTAKLAGKTYDISLAGSVAAMLWIDEQQGRLGGPSALIRKGPATTVPAAPALPVIDARATAGFPAPDAKATKAMVVALRKHLKQHDPDLCDDGGDADSDSDSVWSLDASTKLVGLLCSRGAYNVTTGFWSVTGSDVAKARKVMFPQPGANSDNLLINASFDPATGQVGFFGKARGIGDCGSAGNYAWTGSGFVLTALSEMPECRGVDPEDWPTLYRSDVKLAK
ncbi:DUF1176 domain-containing protein [Bosea sp. 2RAB26]|uniref:DUF1176 domain-containing protein n=1 Tax=Bosea sp. 2RAB26 TaxID=3237476 RepID=UPI003F8F849E